LAIIDIVKGRRT